MTTEVKAMVDALPIVSHSVIDWKETELVNKSDVLELVEKLTAWVKVEDGLPEFKGKPLYILAESAEDIQLVLIEEYEDVDNVRVCFSEWRYIY